MRRSWIPGSAFFRYAWFKPGGIGLNQWMLQGVDLVNRYNPNKTTYDDNAQKKPRFCFLQLEFENPEILFCLFIQE